MGLPYEDVLYKQACKDAPVPYDKSCWTDVKHTLGLPFPNLPYLIDGNLKITQSMAILHHVAMKRPEMNLLGYDEASRANCAMVESEFSDAKSKMTSLMYRGQDGDIADYFNNELPRQLGLFETFLGEKPWFAGEQITVCDFVIREYLDCGQLFSGNSNMLSDNYPRLNSFKGRFEAIPEISAYLSSERFATVSAINNQHAQFR